MIQLNNVGLLSHAKVILKDVTLELSEKKIAIIGDNGSGKTSLLRLLNALVEPDEGEVFVNGVSTKKNGSLIRKKMGLVFQNPDTQIIMPIVEEDLAFGLKNRGLSALDIEKAVDSILNSYNIQHLRGQPIHSLSGGEKQILAICAILITDPSILLFDEPTSGLDFSNKKVIHKIINELDQQIIVVTHDFGLIEKFDRVIVLEAGKVICDDVPKVSIQYYLESRL
ncbi:ABC transporter ATP-binding protein [Bartonella sp. TP]|uniref:energy-coupling factor ABC transporter ATP-binding protein n=1 Tax=Bartonella sp. TP TaxID=3057550 RepID=UPI0025AF6F9C|nr:ABC transporter ATP-binding protein [Bartonella sp. TP]MDN5248515.1 ABC transporter ATP-binding protein [Alphaproteobacteria bacterium]WJW79560.1 ABC transporter ATP-binding protein [Bartonella sp. TP]